MRLSTIVTAALVVACTEAQLHQLMKAAGKLYFGTAIHGEETRTQSSDAKFYALLKDSTMFGQATPGNEQKMDAIGGGGQGKYNYAAGDAILNFASQNGYKIFRCHTLIWHSQLPSWVANGSWNAQTLTSAMQAYISNVVGHYKGKCYAWDVVNEALEENGNYRNSVYYRVLGDKYFGIAFKAARAADSDAKLYYNDYNTDHPGSKADGVARIVKKVQADGAPIDGVGIQAHMTVGRVNQAGLESVLKSYTALGVDVAYTEVDIKHTSVPASAAANQQQAKDYAALTSACLHNARCVGITLWGFHDSHTWIRNGDPTIFDKSGNPKPAYTAISSVLKAAATAAPKPRAWAA